MNPQIMQLDTSRLLPKEAEGPKAEMTGAQEGVPAAPQPTPTAEPLTWEQIEDLKNKIVAVLCTCFDPEIPVNIYELGLIYDIEITPSAQVTVRMTLTTPACPAAGSLPPEVERKVRAVPGVAGVKVNVVWDPPWDKNRMSEAAKLQLGIDD
jgi:FeS assembly SUF system protein